MKFYKGLILAALIAVTVGAKADPPATHGMVLFGHTATYASHLPMFHSPHDYQVVLKISLVNLKSPDAVENYSRLNGLGKDIFTLVPAKMDLTKVISGEISQFEGTLYQGHFEKGGKIIGFVLAKVEKVIFAGKLDPTSPELNQFLIFGEKGEYFGIHLINGKPSYDSILGVKPYTLQISFCRTRACADPIQTPIADDQLPQTIAYDGALNGHNQPAVNDEMGVFGGTIADVVQVIYQEEEDLLH